ncbi:MAG: CoA transferase, partial [Dehalococcoidia bacterium]
APQTIERLGITYDDLRKIREDIIVVRMPGFGLEGLYKNYRIYGNHAEHVVGHTHIRGHPDTDPTMMPTTLVCDALGGLNGAVGALMALRYRRRTGKGQLVEVPQSEVMAGHLPRAFLDYSMNGRVHSTLGNRHSSMAPHGCYPCKGQDRWVSIAVSSDDEWEAFVDVLGHPGWTEDPRFSTVLSRHRHQRELDEHIGNWTRRHESYEVMRLLQSHDIPAGPVMDDRDAFSDPHLRERRFFQALTNTDGGTHLYPGPMWRISGHPNHLRTPPCRLGEHNEYIYKELLGLAPKEYARLEREGHIGTRYVSVPGAPPD